MLALFLAAAIQAPAADPLPPLGKWTVDWGQTHCAALQRYGDPKAPITFVFKPSVDGKTIHMIVSRAGPYQNATHFDVKLGDVATTALVFTPKRSKTQIYWINLARADFDRITRGAALRIDGRKLDLALATTGFAAAAAAMDTCNTDLRSHWNADEAGAARIATRPIAQRSPARYVSADDYPSQANIEGRDGSTGVSLLIDETGAIRDCIVESASGVATLDAQTCIVIRERAKFTPAKDAAGKPIRSRITYRFRWKSG